MNDKELTSDEALNALLDNELDQADQRTLCKLIEGDADLRRRVEQLRSIKSLLQSAYPQGPTIDAPASTVIWSLPRYAVAAIILIMLGVLLGANLDGLIAPERVSNGGLPASANAQQVGQFNVLFHASRNDAAGFRQLLNQAEALLNDPRIDSGNLRIEIVANGDGLNLLRQDNVAFAGEIRRLLSSHGNINFLGCSNSLQRLSEKHNLVFVLMPEIGMVNLGVMHVLQRQRSGWTYIQV